MKAIVSTLSEFLADVVMTGYYLAEPKHRAMQLHDAEMKCLKIINACGPMRMQAVANRMYTTKPRASQLVSALENMRYVRRSLGTDHRVIIVQVTPAGKSVVRESREKYTRLAEQIEGLLGQEKTKELCALLETISPLLQSRQQEPAKVKEGAGI